MTEVYEERRAAPRVSTVIDGLMALEGMSFAIDCRIADINQFGARIRVGNRRLPQAFYLIDVLGSLAYQVEVRWRQESEAGLRFVATHELLKPDAPAWLRILRATRLAADAHERAAAYGSDIPDGRTVGERGRAV